MRLFRRKSGLSFHDEIDRELFHSNGDGSLRGLPMSRNALKLSPGHCLIWFNLVLPVFKTLSCNAGTAVFWPGNKAGPCHPGEGGANFVRWKQGCWRQQPSQVSACPDSSTDPCRVSFELRKFPSRRWMCQLGPTLSFVISINFLSTFGIGGYNPTTSLPGETCWGKRKWDRHFGRGHRHLKCFQPTIPHLKSITGTHMCRSAHYRLACPWKTGKRLNMPTSGEWLRTVM